ncbi:MAG: DUF2827 domain-containing protein [Ramlibacter sp.]
MNIGISILARPDAHILSNGLNQNAAFLAMLLRSSAWVDNIYFLNGGDAQTLPEGMDEAVRGIPLVRPEEVTFSLDVVIEIGAQLPQQWLSRVRALGAKVVAFLVGQPYLNETERPIFSRDGGTLFNGAPWHEIWILPQHAHTSLPMLRTVSRLPVHEVPHIWSPVYVDQHAAIARAQGGTFGFDPQAFQATGSSWRIGIFEPNISVAKYCAIPMLVSEHACRQDAGAVARVAVMNTVHMKEHPTFNRFASHLDITRQGKASYEPRLAFASCMARFELNMVVSHHWECEQNYLYYEALHAGYPLVHNSGFLHRGGVGLYYPGFSAIQGGELLLRARHEPPAFWQAYQQKAGAWLRKLLPDDPVNVDAFMRRLTALGEATP